MNTITDAVICNYTYDFIMYGYMMNFKLLNCSQPWFDWFSKIE